MLETHQAHEHRLEAHQAKHTRTGFMAAKQGFDRLTTEEGRTAAQNQLSKWLCGVTKCRVLWCEMLSAVKCGMMRAVLW